MMFRLNVILFSACAAFLGLATTPTAWATEDECPPISEARPANVQDSLRLCDAALASDRDQDPQRLSDLHYRRGRWREEANIDAAPAHDPQYADAFADFNEAVRLNPNNDSALLGRAGIYLERARVQEHDAYAVLAYNDLVVATQLNPRGWWHYALMVPVCLWSATGCNLSDVYARLDELLLGAETPLCLESDTPHLRPECSQIVEGVVPLVIKERYSIDLPTPAYLRDEAAGYVRAERGLDIALRLSRIRRAPSAVIATNLYGRGLMRVELGDIARGEADKREAMSIDPNANLFAPSIAARH